MIANTNQVIVSLVNALGLSLRKVDGPDENVPATITSYRAADNKLILNHTTFGGETLCGLGMGDVAIDALKSGMKMLGKLSCMELAQSEESDLGILDHKWADAIAEAFPQVQRRFFMTMNCPTDRINGKYLSMVLITEEGDMIAVTALETEDDVSEELLEGILNGSAYTGFFEQHIDELMAVA